jgi:hypothetical protein
MPVFTSSPFFLPGCGPKILSKTLKCERKFPQSLWHEARKEKCPLVSLKQHPNHDPNPLEQVSGKASTWGWLQTELQVPRYGMIPAAHTILLDASFLQWNGDGDGSGEGSSPLGSLPCSTMNSPCTLPLFLCARHCDCYPMISRLLAKPRATRRAETHKIWALEKHTVQ